MNILKIPNNIMKFLSGIYTELTLMEWLTWKDVVRSTTLVIVFTVLLTSTVAGMDALLAAVRQLIITRSF